MSGDQHDQLRHDLGVYVLGALEPAERDRLEQHLSTCQACREELAALAVLPSLLSRLADAEELSGMEPPSFDGVLRRIAQERRRARRRERLLAAAAALATVAALVVVVVSAVSPTPPDARSFTAAAGDATATVEQRPWGMAVDLAVRTLPPQPGYSAWAVSEDGHRAQLASWTAVDRPVQVQGSCYLSPDEVVHLEIVGAQDEAVLAVLRPE